MGEIEKYLQHKDNPEIPFSEGKEKDALDFIWDTAALYPTDAKAQTHKQWQKLQADLVKKPVRNFYFGYISIAASLLLLFGLWFVFYPSKTNKEHTLTDNTQTTEINSSTKLAIHKLPNGSYITLKPNSSIVLSGNNKMVVELKKGTAFFNIAKNTFTSFIVKSSEGNVLVTGTQFTVSSKANQIKVAVNEGSVEFNTSDNKIYKIKSAKALVKNRKGIIETVNINDLAQEFNWTSGILTFDNKEFAYIIKQLEDFYSVKLTFDQTLSQRKVTVTFDNITLEQAISVLENTLETKITRE